MPATGVVLVDDVVTTGRTLETAIALLGPEKVALAVSANAAPPVSSLLTPTHDQFSTIANSQDRYHQ